MLVAAFFVSPWSFHEKTGASSRGNEERRHQHHHPSNTSSFKWARERNRYANTAQKSGAQRRINGFAQLLPPDLSGKPG